MSKCYQLNMNVNVVNEIMYDIFFEKIQKGGSHDGLNMIQYLRCEEQGYFCNTKIITRIM